MDLSTQERDGDVLVVTAHGDLNAGSCGRLEQELNARIDAGRRRLVRIARSTPSPRSTSRARPSSTTRTARAPAYSNRTRRRSAPRSARPAASG